MTEMEQNILKPGACGLCRLEVAVERQGLACIDLYTPGHTYEVEPSGALRLSTTSGRLVVLYAPATWQSVRASYPDDGDYVADPQAAQRTLAAAF